MKAAVRNAWRKRKGRMPHSPFTPDRYFSRITSIDIKRDLLDCGLRFAFLDIDNTLRSRADGRVPQDVCDWIARAEAAGVKLCLLSNNFHQNALDFADAIGLPIVAKAMKPLPPGYISALRKMGAHRHEAVVIGDQISTDIVGARALHIKAYLVVPLATRDLAHMRVIRHVESALLGGRVPEGGVAYD